jgi:membrane protein implicated in regulation of membrane protease activity
MSHRAYAVTTGLIFVLIAAGHVLRLAFGWKAIIAGQSIPTWVSWIAFAILAFLAYEGFRLARKPQ